MSRVARSKTEREAAEALGRRIATLRKDKEITQVQLAEMLGISQPVISQYELGRLRPPHDFILRFAEALHVSTDLIFGLQKTPKARDAEVLDRRFVRRLKLVQGLPRRDQDALLRTIDAFLTARDAR
jgi:transcriptional regulator with XRE-family HTH domain